jgi:hypothetical protein
MKSGSMLIAAAALGLAACGAALAQDEEKPAPIPFAGGTLTITQQEEYGEKTLAFEGKELARAYFVSFDGIVKVGGEDVALFDVGDGGNACGPARVMVWKPEGQEVQKAGIGEDDCGAPPAGVSEDAIYFVPWLLPGASADVRKWSPQEGFTLAGKLTYTPDPGTGWADVDPAKYENIIDAFHNEAVYQKASALLGDGLTDMATSLLVGGGTEKTASGIAYASGCLPHACGVSDGFMAVDAKGGTLYFARQKEGSKPDAWPRLEDWPADLRQAMEKALAPQQ